MKGNGKRRGQAPGKASAAARDKTAGDGGETWSPGLHDDAKAALLGRILAAMPHADALLAEAVAGRVGSATARLILRDVHDEPARLANHLDRLSLAARVAPVPPKVQDAGSPKRIPEKARPKRPAPIGEPGARQPRAPVRPARAPAAPEPAVAAAPATAAE